MDESDDDALTIDELIDRLERIRLTHGGQALVLMADYEPVVRAVYHCKTDRDGCLFECVFLTDRYAGQDEDDALAEEGGGA
jgi:hypothetical protein